MILNCVINPILNSRVLKFNVSVCYKVIGLPSFTWIENVRLENTTRQYLDLIHAPIL